MHLICLLSIFSHTIFFLCLSQPHRREIHSLTRESLSLYSPAVSEFDNRCFGTKMLENVFDMLHPEKKFLLMEIMDRTECQYPPITCVTSIEQKYL